jgi:trehalose 6-phosphate phosphatase
MFEHMLHLRPPPCRSEWALFLDLDGTLLEIAATPAAVHASARLRRTLSALAARLGGALAIVSGRTIDVVDALLEPLRLPVAGIHGVTRRDGHGRIHGVAAPDARVARARASLAAFAAERPGLALEDKGTALALHYRLAPELECDALAVVAGALAQLGPQFEIQHGKMVLELKPRSADKGRAIEQYMREPPFEGRTPAFVGDDLTDEPGFAVVNGMGGCSVKVGGADTCARWRLADVGQVLDWLESCAGPDAGARIHDGS